VAFALVHYILWFLPVWAAGTLLWRVHATIGPAMVIGAALAYVVTFFDGSERKSGRPWDGFRVSWLWRLLHVRTSLGLVTHAASWWPLVRHSRRCKRLVNRARVKMGGG
jgi:hypothetical protein